MINDTVTTQHDYVRKSFTQFCHNEKIPPLSLFLRILWFRVQWVHDVDKFCVSVWAKQRSRYSVRMRSSVPLYLLVSTEGYLLQSAAYLFENIHNHHFINRFLMPQNQSITHSWNDDIWSIRKKWCLDNTIWSIWFWSLHDEVTWCKTIIFNIVADNSISVFLKTS